MSGPDQPWWARPGGAPVPGGPPPPAARPARPVERQSPGRHPSAPTPQRHERPAAPPQGTPQPPSRPKRGQPDRRLLIGGAVAVVAVAAIGGGLWMRHRADANSTRLDVRRAEAGVAQILSDPINGYGANRVVAVACNNGKNPVVRTGATFTCAVEINDTLRRVIVEFTDNNGTYAVDGPR